MKKDQKSLLQRMFIGFKKGYLMPTLPQNILDLHNHPIARVYRVVCGLSLLLLVNKKVTVYLNPYPIVYYSALFASITFLFYMIYITYHRIRHMYHLLKNKELDVRNSPLDRLGSVCSKLLFCVKGACDATAPVGVILGVTLGIDSIRESSGFKPLFTPIYAKILLPKSAAAIEDQNRSEIFQRLGTLANEKKSSQVVSLVPILKGSPKNNNKLNNKGIFTWKSILLYFSIVFMPIILKVFGYNSITELISVYKIGFIFNLIFGYIILKCSIILLIVVYNPQEEIEKSKYYKYLPKSAKSFLSLYKTNNLFLRNEFNKTTVIAIALAILILMIVNITLLFY